MPALKFRQLKVLPVEEAIGLINHDLQVLSHQKKNTHDFGKHLEIDGLKLGCSWSSVFKHYKDLGYRLNGDTYQLEYIGDYDVSNQKLTAEEIVFVKEQFRQFQQGTGPSASIESPELKVEPRTGKKKVSSNSFYIDTLEDWNEFKSQHAYSGTDLMDLALREFMAKYGFVSKNKES